LNKTKIKEFEIFIIKKEYLVTTIVSSNVCTCSLSNLTSSYTTKEHLLPRKAESWEVISATLYCLCCIATQRLSLRYETQQI